MRFVEFEKFIHMKNKVGRGWIFRCISQGEDSFVYEETVDFMLIEDHHSPSGYTIIVVSGRKAGCVLVRLPEEAGSFGKGIDSKWLFDKWNKCINFADPKKILVYRIETDGSDPFEVYR